jgi:hypothetical protein
MSGKVESRDDIHFAVESNNAMRFAVHRREWKLVREVPTKGGDPKNYLFRIEEDPNEKNDIADKNPKLVADLVESLERWRKLHPANGVRESDPQPQGYQVPKQWVEAARD